MYLGPNLLALGPRIFSFFLFFSFRANAAPTLQTLHKALLFFLAGRTSSEPTATTLWAASLYSMGHHALRALRVVGQVKFSKLYLGNGRLQIPVEPAFDSSSAIHQHCDFEQVTHYTSIFSTIRINRTTLHICTENRQQSQGWIHFS